MIPFDEYYWYLKKLYPGDLEFTYSRYWELPYFYIIEAVNNARKMRREELHENEVPITLLACQQAEFNRDSKKNKKPYQMDDFYCYASSESKDSVDAIYGSAAKKLIELKMFPGWGLYMYKELTQNASKAKPPEVLCYQCETAIILAPKIMNGVCKGMLLATEKASRRSLELTAPNGDIIRLRMPDINGKVVAIENCYLDII